MRILFVAAGGGGDAVGILLARRILAPHDAGPALISTCAWERLRVDPVPGPRSLSGFTGLGFVDGEPAEVLPSCDTTPPGRSMLPRLAAEADARIFLHDFEHGAQGLAQRLRFLASALSVARLVVVDVGGDVLATGKEPGLLSPLADSLTLAAALQTEVPTSLAVIGPGSDAELPEDEVRRRLDRLGATVAGTIDPASVDELRGILAWHPTEASALVAASALGEQGAVEMRRGLQLVPLTSHTAEAWLLTHPRIHDFPLAHAVQHSTTMRDARQTMASLAVDEIAYEEAKSVRTGEANRQGAQELIVAAHSRGATHITARRWQEATGQNRGSGLIRI